MGILYDKIIIFLINRLGNKIESFDLMSRSINKSWRVQNHQNITKSILTEIIKYFLKNSSKIFYTNDLTAIFTIFFQPLNTYGSLFQLIRNNTVIYIIITDNVQKYNFSDIKIFFTFEFNFSTTFKHLLLTRILQLGVKQQNFIQFEILQRFSNFIHHIYTIDVTETISITDISFKIFTKHFQIKKLSSITQYINFFLNTAYLGGTNELYKYNINNPYIYDINNQYGAAMRHKQPLGSYKLVTKNKLNIKEYFGFFLVYVKTHKKFIPLTPFESENLLVTSTGSWKGIYTTKEIVNLISYGYQIQLINGVYFKKGYIFNDLIKHFHHIKNECISLYTRYLSKFLTVSLYGYFGLRTKLTKHISTSQNTILKITNYLNKKIHYEIAANVTAEARLYLYKWLLRQNISYTDTDSIFITRPFINTNVNLLVGNIKENTVCVRIIFLNIKFYQYENIRNQCIWKQIRAKSISKLFILLTHFPIFLKNYEFIFFSENVKWNNFINKFVKRKKIITQLPINNWQKTLPLFFNARANTKIKKF